MKIGILGGASFFKNWDIPFKQLNITTPYGKPSDLICSGMIGQHEIFTLQRHGQEYQLPLQEIPWQANAYAFHMQEADFVIEVTACGSLRASDHDGDLVLFDQVIDLTTKRPPSLGRPALKKVTYLDFSKPISETLLHFASTTFTKHDIQHHQRGTMLVEEGPKYSSLAESKMYKIFGADFVNQTSMPELYFLRELSIPTLAITMITNGIDLESDGKILSKDISNSIAKFKDIMPNAILTLIKEIPTDTLPLESFKENPYDISGFELRTKEEN